MKYEVYELVENSGVWVAEAVDPEGEVHRAIFEGTESKASADEYAQWKNWVPYLPEVTHYEPAKIKPGHGSAPYLYPDPPIRTPESEA